MKRTVLILLIHSAFAVWLFGQKPWYRQAYAERAETQANLTFQLWLLGDGGKPDAERQEPTFAILQQQLEQVQVASAVVFLGDNIYPSGMPPANNPERKEAERRITEQLKMVKNYRGRVVFLPGNHDWENSGPEGLQQVQEEERFIESYLASNEVFLPGNACPGPAVVELDEERVMLILDTQWWLHGHTRTAEPNPCTVETDSAFLHAVQAALTKHSGRQIIVCAHHPMISNGNHGGYYSWKNHLFPLTMLKKNLYFPIPVLGTMGVGYRKYRGSVQDIPHPRYRALRNSLMDIFAGYPNLIYAAGHEHNLQYHHHESQHYIVSGAGTKTTYVRKGRQAQFVHAHKGFARIDFFQNGQRILRFFEADETGNSIEIYSQILD